jgi:hypothetical protein
MLVASSPKAGKLGMTNMVPLFPGGLGNRQMLSPRGGAKARPHEEAICSRGSGLRETADEWGEAQQAGGEQE